MLHWFGWKKTHFCAFSSSKLYPFSIIPHFVYEASMYSQPESRGDTLFQKVVRLKTPSPRASCPSPVWETELMKSIHIPVRWLGFGLGLGLGVGLFVKIGAKAIGASLANSDDAKTVGVMMAVNIDPRKPILSQQRF